MESLIIEPLSIVFRSIGTILTSPIYYFYMCVGAFIGILFGAIPGLTGTTAVIMLLPLTIFLPINLSLVFLLSIFKGGMFGGAISAILLGIPGSPGAVATVIDGYPLGQKGQGLKAIKMALFSSMQGDSMWTLFAILSAPFVAKLIMYISSPEIFLIIFACLLLVGFLTTSYYKETSLASIAKAIISGAAGLMITIVGVEPIFGTNRFSFGTYQLQAGMDLIPVFLGLFGIAMVLEILVGEVNIKNLQKIQVPKPKQLSDTKVSWKEYRFCQKVICFGSFIGATIGLIPGIGCNAAGLISHGMGRHVAKDKNNYGKGSLEGVAICESANSAVYGTNLLPLVTLGIPGSAEAAVLIAAFLIQGVPVGPLLINHEPGLIYGMFGGMLIADLFVLFIGIVAMHIFIKAVSLPRNILFPVITILLFIGTYAGSQWFFHFWVVIAFGILGYFMNKFGFSTSSLCIGFVLGRYAEMNFNHTIIILHGDILKVFFRPAFIILLVTMIMVGIIIKIIGRKRKISRRI